MIFYQSKLQLVNASLNVIVAFNNKIKTNTHTFITIYGHFMGRELMKQHPLYKTTRKYASRRVSERV